MDETADPAKQLEAYKHEFAKGLEEHKAKLNVDAENRRFDREKFLGVWRALYEFAQIALRTVIFVNGAGAAAILAFLGNTMKDARLPLANTKLLAIAGGVFAAGVGAGFFATILAYQSQYKLVMIYLETGVLAHGTRWERGAAVLSGICGLVLFGLGLTLAMCAYVLIPDGALKP
jgi:hypothetical protein